MSAVLTACAPQSIISAHDVRVSGDQNGRRTVTLDLSWRDAFHDSITWNAAWVFLKYRADGHGWTHATLSTVPSDHATGAGLTIVPAADGRGVLVHRTNVGRGPVDISDLRVVWNAARDGVSANAAPDTRAFALDMVRVPAGPYYLGDGEIGNVAGHFRTADRNVPFPVTSEDSITLGGVEMGALGNGNGYGMNVGDDFDDTRTATLPPAFPKGVRPFYLMRYELTEREYADFLNTLTADQVRARNPAQPCASNRLLAACPAEAQPAVRRYGLTTVPPFITFAPTRPVHPLSWIDAAAYADWAGLRPYTELEYEKAARGPRYPEPGTYAWGTTRIHRGRYTLASDRSRLERVTNPGWAVGNAAFVETMGDPTPDCHSCLRGPLPAGTFARDTAGAEEAGTSYYGIFELSGNLIERVVSVASPSGRAFGGRHGDGVLSGTGHAAGDEVSTWPGARMGPSGWRVDGAQGTGLRGGGWNSQDDRLRVSDRADAAVADTARGETYGYRFARTDPLDSLVTVPDSAGSASPGS